MAFAVVPYISTRLICSYLILTINEPGVELTDKVKPWQTECDTNQQRCQEKIPPGKSPPRGFRVRVRVRLGIGLFLGSGNFFSRVFFPRTISNNNNHACIFFLCRVNIFSTVHLSSVLKL